MLYEPVINSESYVLGGIIMGGLKIVPDFWYVALLDSTNGKPPFETKEDALTTMEHANLCKTPFKLLENGTNWLVYGEDTEESSVSGLNNTPVDTTIETIILASSNTIPVKVMASIRPR